MLPATSVHVPSALVLLGHAAARVAAAAQWSVVERLLRPNRSCAANGGAMEGLARLRISANVTGDFGNVTDFGRALGCAEKIVGMEWIRAGLEPPRLMLMGA